MTSPRSATSRMCQVVVNEAGHVAIWPRVRQIPDGWRAVGPPEPLEDCHRRLEAYPSPHSVAACLRTFPDVADAYVSAGTQSYIAITLNDLRVFPGTLDESWAAHTYPAAPRPDEPATGEGPRFERLPHRHVLEIHHGPSQLGELTRIGDLHTVALEQSLPPHKAVDMVDHAPFDLLVFTHVVETLPSADYTERLIAEAAAALAAHHPVGGHIYFTGVIAPDPNGYCGALDGPTEPFLRLSPSWFHAIQDTNDHITGVDLIPNIAGPAVRAGIPHRALRFDVILHVGCPSPPAPPRAVDQLQRLTSQQIADITSKTCPYRAVLPRADIDSVYPVPRGEDPAGGGGHFTIATTNDDPNIIDLVWWPGGYAQGCRLGHTPLHRAVRPYPGLPQPSHDAVCRDLARRLEKQLGQLAPTHALVVTGTARAPARKDQL